MAEHNYTEDNIKSLDWREHIRIRPGMYIGKLGDGKTKDDGIYVLIKEIIDNSIDEYVMGNGKKIEVSISDEGSVKIRDYGRGIPLGKVIDCVSKINTGGKYDSKAFKKSVGLNGVGTKAVNALSDQFRVYSVREGEKKEAIFERGALVEDRKVEQCNERNGTFIEFHPDESIFKNYLYNHEYVEEQLWNYAYLNAGLTIHFNGKKIRSDNGLRDLLENQTKSEQLLYPIIHIKDDDIEMAMSHSNQYGEEYYSFVNGQHTTQGGTHLAAFREALVGVIRNFYNKNFDVRDIRTSIVAAISVKVEEPVFESQTKTKLGSTHVGADGPTIRTFLNDFLSTKLENFLYRNTDVSDIILKKIKQSEKERKEIAGIKKIAKEKAKVANVHNKKLRDCKVHLSDKKGNQEDKRKSTIFITEGDSASGSITQARDVRYQAIFSLRGKPLNCFGMSKKVVYQNEELNLLQHALKIEDGLEGLRYNNVVIASDADVDGMHIRLLILTFFLQFFPDLVREGHLYILETPLFRVRNKKETIYCYSEEERKAAVDKIGKNAEITRFKGLGEISPGEFENFINENIRLAPVRLSNKIKIEELLTYYMGKNTMDRQEFIIENLRFELDEIVEEETFTKSKKLESVG
ncbi:DNA topoisomerase IV subunit B [Membranihabitans maritimus]|uniref:DNA topoisomerase IV subunit B n=1 Tax=Membranihabitans maritimus TaxID=2904244 RepID=UPI001F202CC1|nr:DNA topoisomerase IV subunit B [Membranihabitans maritimus]